MVDTLGSLKGCHKLARDKLGEAQARPGKTGLALSLDAIGVQQGPGAVQRLQRCGVVLPSLPQGGARLFACQHPSELALG